jgi:hypothetical protein
MKLKTGGYMKSVLQFLMRVNAYLLLTLFLSVILFSTAYTQTCNLSMAVTHVPVQSLSPSDIDFEHFESRNLLFTINIANTNTQEVSARLFVVLDIFLSDGSQFSDAISFNTNRITIPVGGKIITNLDLNSSGEIRTEHFRFDQNAKNRIQDIALSTGKFPAGIYQFSLSLDSVICGQATGKGDQGIVKLTIQNTSRINLKTPLNGETTTDRPFFEFFNDADCGVLTVAEKTDDQSPEDAISHLPAMLEIELCNQNSFLYSGGRPLEDGKTYVWKVVSRSKGTGGSEMETSSPIWSFKVSNSSNDNMETGILFQLEEMYAQKYPSIFDQIRQNNFAMTGNYLLNGSNISLSDLLNVLIQLRENTSAELSFE